MTEPLPDVDLVCWFCDKPFGRVEILKDAFLVPRHDRDGGPYRSYRCTRCDRVIHIERNRAGAYWARPPESIPMVDSLFAFFDAGIAAEVHRKKDWQRRSAGKRDWFHGAYAEQVRAGDARPHAEARSAPPPRTPPPGPSGPGPRPGPTPRPVPAPEPEPRRAPAAPPPPDPFDPYAVLGLGVGASREECVAAFRELAKRYHPDRFATLDDAFQRLAHDKFVELKRAYDELVGEETGR